MVNPALVQQLAQQLFERQRTITGLIVSIARDRQLADEIFSTMSEMVCEGKLTWEERSSAATTKYLEALTIPRSTAFPGRDWRAGKPALQVLLGVLKNNGP